MRVIKDIGLILIVWILAFAFWEHVGTVWGGQLRPTLSEHY